MKHFCLVSGKRWHNDLFESLSNRKGEQWFRIQSKDTFSYEFLSDNKIDKVFIPHWSYIIPPQIFDNFECIVFHMTDLPYGRGGSPLQNLIIKGHQATKISAIKVAEGLDTGDVYLKEPLSLFGTSEEIFMRSSEIIQKMIETIIEKDLHPEAQVGNPVIFQRRTPEEGDISSLEKMEKVYDFIRMLDCEGYPNAFLETNHFRFEFSRASLKGDKSIHADVRIIKK